MSASAAASPPTTLVPIVYWSQSAAAIHLKVDVKETERSKIALKASGRTITITATSRLKPEVTYRVELELFAPVVPTPTMNVLPHSFTVTFAKVETPTEEWPRLLADSTKLDKNKVKVDWDAWHDPDAETDALAAAEKEKLKAEWNELQNRKKLGTPAGMQELMKGFEVSANPALAAIPMKTRMRLTYLLVYNMFVLAGIFIVLFLTLQNIFVNFHARPAKAGSEAHSGGLTNAFFVGLGTLHQRVGSLMYFIQLLASLEIVHAATGLIAGRVLPSVLLNLGRDIILYGCIALFETSHSSWCVGALYFLWCLGDLVRYVYYLMQLVQSSNEARLIAESWFSSAVLMMLTDESATKVTRAIRYTLPLFLLPFGFVTEIGVVFAASPQMALVPVLGTSLTVDQLFRAYCVPAYLLGAPALYFAVLAQRKKKLRAKRATTEKSASSSSASSSSDAASKDE